MFLKSIFDVSKGFLDVVKSNFYVFSSIFDIFKVAFLTF